MSDPVIAALRVIHIVFGAFWLGGAATLGFFLLPAMKAAGPIGGQLAAQLMARTRLLAVITAAGAIAIFAGFSLYRGIWAGGSFAGPARWYGIGGHFPLIAVLLAGVVAVPASHKLGALARTLPGDEASPTAAQNAEGRLINRLTLVTQITAVLVIVTVAFMAIGRYV
jgi:uncharacterized membrane protein